MKKFTAKVAKKLSENTKATEPTTFQDVINFLEVEARCGHSNTFIDGKRKTLKVIKKELEERGFNCYLSKSDGYLEVYW